MTADQELSIAHHFADLTDPRIDRSRLHELLDITAIPKLLKMLEISGAIVTIDAMGCQKEIARTIRGREADYVLALKANHENLFGQVVAFWDGACGRGMKGPDIAYHREWSEGHGRTEARRCWATSDLDWLSGREE